MTLFFETTGLSESRRAVIMRAAGMLVAVVAFGSFAQSAAAQQPQEKRDDLDVTMQVIVDPDAKAPDEVVRRIALPPRKEPASASQSQSDTNKGQERAEEARQQGREVSEAAREKNNEAAEQREQARRSMAEEARRRNPPKDPPNRPDPPRRP